MRSWSLPVVLALATPVIGQRAPAEDIARALDRARPVMLEMAKSTHGGHHALLCLAMAHDGLTSEHEGFRSAIDRLARSVLRQTYEVSLRLMVMAAVKDFPDRTATARRDLKTLLANQNGGGFNYSPKGSGWDLSNTQYAALGMRAAASLGVPIPRRSWESLARAVLAGQIYRGGFGYRPKSISTPSMSVAGIAVLEICQQQLNSSGTLGKQIQRGIDSTWAYMVANKATIGAGRGNQRDYYYHYGLERAAILSGKTLVGDVDWYAVGAKMFLAQESKGGGWGSAQFFGRGGRGQPPAMHTAAPVSTAFAVLFLRRSFRRTLSGPITPARNVYLKDLPAQADDAIIRTTAALEVSRGYRAVPDLLRGMRSPILARRKVVALALPVITQQFRSFSPYATPADAAGVIKAAELWWLREGPKLLGKCP